MGQEIEYKLRAPDADALARAYVRVGTAAAAGQEQIIEMDTRYFDTPEGVLRARRWTLRIRRENDRSVLTCKTPGQGHSRGEWELVRTADAPAPTASELRALAELGAPETLTQLEELRPVCGAHFTRRCVTLTLPDAIIELAADAGELFGARERERFFELELELKSGNAGRLAELADIAALPEEPLSKQARAMRLL